MKIKLLVVLGMFFLQSYTNVWGQNIGIVPAPQQIQYGSGTYTLNPNIKIAFDGNSHDEAILLQQYFAQKLGFKLELIKSNKLGTNVIQFKLDSGLAKEAYDLVVNSDGIQISAADKTGWFYAIQSIKQLLLIDTDTANSHKAGRIPALSIKDSPRFSWRAFMLDEGRYFKGKDQVKMLLDEMAELKMNVFHWHLVDDQGWRIEIKKYPRLTQIGSTRKSSQVGPLHWDSNIQSGEVHQGFYTQEDIKEIVKYAQQRHITIVPEIEMPGHSTAAIAAYSWLGTAKKEIETPTRFGVSTDVYDVGDERVFTFLTDVLDEVMQLFPSKVIHIGGDEVKYDHWKNSKSIQAYMKSKGLNSPAELQVYFTNRISQYLNSKNRRMMGWNEILGDKLHEYQNEEDTKSNQKLAPNTVVHFWKGDLKLATRAAKNGFDIVNSLHTNTYLDYDYKTIPLSKAYSFEPIPEGLDSQYHDKIIGIGCQMWSEWIPTDGQMHYQVFPRIAAYAEVAWTKPESKDFAKFKVALTKLEAGWKEKGIYFAPDSDVEKSQ